MTIQTIATLKSQMPIGVNGGTTVSDLHDIVDTMEDRTTQDVLTKTANYPATTADNRRRFVFNSATNVTLTIPNNVPVGWECSILQLGAGQVIVSVTGGNLRAHNNHTRTSAQYAQAYLWCYANAGTAPQIAMSGDTSV